MAFHLLSFAICAAKKEDSPVSRVPGWEQRRRGQANVLKELKGPSPERTSQHRPPLPRNTQWLLVFLRFELTRKNSRPEEAGPHDSGGGITRAGCQDRLDSKAHV